MHGLDQATAPTGSPPPVVATTAPSQSRSDGHPPGRVMRVDFFLDPVGGWTCWIPRWPAEAQQSAEEHPTAWRQSRPGQRMLVGLCQQLAVGVTTVRDLGDRRWAALGWRDRLVAGNGRLSYPTIVASGPPITSPGGHCWHMGGEAAGVAQLRQAVRERADRRVDVVKVMASGGNTTPGTDIMACQFTLQELQLVVEEAHRHGLAVTAHAHGLPAVEQAVAAGVDGIEHASCLTPTGIRQPDQLLEGLAAHQTAVCPTLGWAPGVPVNIPPAVLARMAKAGITLEAFRAAVARAHHAGIRLVAGSDAGIAPVKPHGVLPETLVSLVEAGIPAVQALASATSVAAWACGLGDRKGRLRAGYDADLLVVDGDPLADIGALCRVSAVMVQGAMADLGQRGSRPA